MELIVYLVTESEVKDFFSTEDYIIHGIFSTKELAEEFKAKCDNSQELDVEEWKVDEKSNWIVRTGYACQLDYIDGHLIREQTYEELADPNATVSANGWCSFVSAEHAREMAFARFQEARREKTDRYNLASKKGEKQ